MKTVFEVKRDLDPMLMANQVMSDPAHQARIQARRERARIFQQTKTERELERVKAQRAKDVQTFQAREETSLIRFQTRYSELIGSAALVSAACLAFGYILALM